MIKIQDNLILWLKGMIMGAADSVPGVSGGTIAFISGIYEELITSIRSCDHHALLLLFKLQFKALWQHINGRFLAVLLTGILTSLIIFSHFILYLLQNYPTLIWSFFFGLIMASTIVVGRTITKWSPMVIASTLGGIIIGYSITIAVPLETPTAWWFIFITGMVAICAMILPGISGSFILVLLAKYEFILTALKDFNVSIIILFSSGAALGLISFSHLLNYLLKQHHNATIAMLTGIMLGSLNKVWPWKHVLETYTNHKGIVKPLVEQNVLPTSYLELTQHQPYLLYAVILVFIGFILVYWLGSLAKN